MKEVTVIIPNWNGKRYLTSCLQALYKNTTIEIDVVVVDNGSQDKSIEEVKDFYPNVRYIMLDKNYGFSRAVNEGIKCAKTPYVLLLNNDMEIKKGFVEVLLDRIKRDKTIFSVEAKMLQHQNSHKIDSAGTFYNALGWAFARGNGQDASKYEKRCEVFATCAGAAIYRKNVFGKIGLFDENYFAYLEDIDIGYRARIHGYRNLYEPKAKTLHVGSASTGGKHNRFKVKYSARNNIYLIYRNMPWAQIMLNAPFLFVGFGIKFMYFLRKGFAKEYLIGIKEGFKLCRNIKKLKFVYKKLGNYVAIQFALWRNLGKRRW